MRYSVPMDGLALLLASGSSVEKVHQAVWFALLRETKLLAALGLESPADAEVTREPDNGIFDLAVLGGGATIWIELKVDSGLSEHQRCRQLEHGKGGQIVYAFLGLSAARSRPSPAREIKLSEGRVLEGVEVAQALDEVVGDASTSQAGRQLAQAYARLLRKLAERGDDFRVIGDKDWRSVHSVHLFERLRSACPSMKDAAICYVSNASGGFEACHWSWTPAGEGVRTYLQWEDTRLCFKILVEAQALRRDRRSKAVAFLRGKMLAGVEVERPKRLGSGRTVTVGYVVLPVREVAKWPDVVAAVDLAVEVNKALARSLSGPVVGDGGSSKLTAEAP